ncbi:MAG TPA: helical backbone metal receptor [Salinimicrobium sp.]|nr:helical backbone metal receptor [Salinimicrobium sp.]
MTKFIDDLGRELELVEKPKRIVSLVPSQTELLVDLGLEDALVGITKFCVHPKRLRKQIKIVGGTKKVNVEKIRALQPEIILCNKEENTEEMVQELEKIAPVHVSDIKTIQDTLNLIKNYGEIFLVQQEASAIAQKIENRLAEHLEVKKDKPEKRVAYLIWKNPWMVAGKDTFINHLLEINGLKNVFLDKNSRYPEISLEEINNRSVDVVMLSTEPYPFQEKHRNLILEKCGVQKVEIVDGEFFSWYGSRLISAFEYFRRIEF